MSRGVDSMLREGLGFGFRQGLMVLSLIAMLAIAGCFGGGSGDSSPSGVGAASSAVLVPRLSLAVGERLFVSGETVAVLGTSGMAGPSALHITSLDPSFGPTAPLRSLDVSAGITGLRTTDRFLAWLRPGATGTDPKRLRVYGANDLGTPGIEDAE
jgi:hypothetical protein